MRVGMWQTKFGYYHLSSHMGDEFLVRNNTLDRINYVRETLMFGVGLFLNPNFRLYSEIDYAFHTDGGSEPSNSNSAPNIAPSIATGYRGSSVSGGSRASCIRKSSFGGSVTAQIGWQWRGRTAILLRTGFQYFNGMSEQAQVLQPFRTAVRLGIVVRFLIGYHFLRLASLVPRLCLGTPCPRGSASPDCEKDPTFYLDIPP